MKVSSVKKPDTKGIKQYPPGLSDNVRIAVHMVDVCSDALNMSERRLKDAITKLMEICEHIEIVEGLHSPPHRICTTCGAEEIGWNFHVLRRCDREVNDDEFYSYRNDINIKFVGWCYGNRYFNEHPVDSDKLQYDEGTRCCEEHTIEYMKEKRRR